MLHRLSSLLLVGLSYFAQAEEPLISAHLQALTPSTHLMAPSASTRYDLLQANAAADREMPFWQDKIYGILTEHYRHTAAAPAYLQEDLALMAEYFARFNPVRNLFAELEGQQWHWQYGKHQAETRVHGTRLQVRSVTVHFDSRAGAQFQFRDACTEKIPYCFTAPADVFLHELLHVRAILKSPKTFIAQGGMAEHIYPHRHEQQTLAAERQLYAAMSRQDEMPRPTRSSHRGRRTSTHCVTCLQ